MDANEQQLSRSASLRRPWLPSLLILGILMVLTALAVSSVRKWRPRSESPPPAVDEDPRRSFVTPFLNVRPEVHYVEDERCSVCHEGHASRYRRHPMGRSLAPMAQAETVERYGTDNRNPFPARGATFQIERREGKVFHKEVHRDGNDRIAAAVEAEVHYALGSGRQGRSYLINRGGYLFQSPISWYSEKSIWDLSPGYQPLFRGFQRPINIDCLFCHSNRVEPIEHTLCRYQEPIFRGHAIGCQRCHGPGELHIESRQRGDAPDGPDPTIVNPRHLEPALREAVCQQCHLLGEARIVRRGRAPFDYRPGLPLELFLSIFVRPPEAVSGEKSVGHVEQMYASGCFRGSGGRLGCISCHDPHELPAPEQRVAHYRGRCLQCHGESACRLPANDHRRKERQDSCIDCHMPRGDSGTISHAAVTDHRIPRKANRASPPRPGQRKVNLALVHFHSDRAAPPDRDLARTLIGLARGWNFDAMAQQAGRRALPLLDRAMREAPEDVEASADRAFALWLMGQRHEALTACESTLALAPTSETALGDAAYFAVMLDHRARAIDYWRRLLKVNPWQVSVYFDIARALADGEEWDEALRQCRAGLRIDPTNVKGRLILVMYHAKHGEPKKARAEFDIILALKPPNEEMLRRWFASLNLP